MVKLLGDVGDVLIGAGALWLLLLLLLWLTLLAVLPLLLSIEVRCCIEFRPRRPIKLLIGFSFLPLFTPMASKDMAGLGGGCCSAFEFSEKDGEGEELPKK